MAEIKIERDIVDEVVSFMKKSSAIIIVDYRGLTSEEDTKFRKAIRDAGGKYKVYKNKYLIDLFKGTNYEELTKHLNGPAGTIFCTGNVAAIAKVVLSASQSFTDFKIKGSVVKGKYCSGEDLKELKEEDFVDYKEEKYNVELENIGLQKGNVSRAIRKLTGWGFFKTKSELKNLPLILIRDVSEDEAMRLRAELENLGATINLR